MDLPLYGRVLWRFRVLVTIGLVVAAVLALLSVLRVDVQNGFDVKYRQQERWTSDSMVWVTQAGFPLGRAVYDQYLKVGDSPNAPVVAETGDPNRFTGLAALYATLVPSDPVLALVRKTGKINGEIAATQPTLQSNPTAGLPFVQIAASAPSAAGAKVLARRATAALLAYVKLQQDSSGIPLNRRVLLQVVKEPTPAALTGKRSFTRPIVVFLATMLLVLGLAFVLENVRPRVRAVAAESPDVATPPASRRTA